MPNSGTLRLTLHGVDSQPAEDRVTISILRGTDGTELLRRSHRFQSSVDLTVPAFPTEHLLQCQITPQRYRHRSVGFMTLTDGEVIERRPTVFRRPTEWDAAFTPWAQLGSGFRRLKRVLTDSPGLRISNGKLLAPFTGDDYDSVASSDRPIVQAKTAMLNVFAKLQTIVDPIGAEQAWFDFVIEILEISRERLIAIVDEDMLDRVRAIHSNIDDFPEYKRTPVGDHQKNLPPAFRVRKADMLSVKTREDHGNVQLTLTPAIGPANTSVVLLDADIDENGRLMAHLADLFKHAFNGGTHPFDIHEFLVLEDNARDLGYTLV
jgi:hypothetical protein